MLTPITTVVSKRNGMWLLLSAMALAVLVIAGLSLLRLLRSNGQWWDGRIP